MDERDAAASLKRKRQSEANALDGDGGINSELPLALQPTEKKPKRRKVEATYVPSDDKESGNPNKSATEVDEENRQRKAEQKSAKRERKRARQAKLKEKKDKLKQKKKDTKSESSQPKVNGQVKKNSPVGNKEDNQSDSEDEEEEEADAAEIDAEVAKSFSVIDEKGTRSTASPSPAPESVLSPQMQSGTSSISSVQAPSIALEQIQSIKTDPASTPTPVVQGPTPADKGAAKERLATRISELRAARKADDPEKKPGSRQELLDQRRRKEEAAKKAKKDQRRKEKEEELRKQEAEIAKRFSPGGSGSLLASPRSPMVDDSNFSFSRVAFGDGTQADATLTGLLDPKKRKGPADAATALQAAQNKAKRISGYDADKRKEIEEKDMWLNAKKKAYGERVRDDTSLLKKALKRQEGNKRKSEHEWTGRIDGVQKGQEMRQKKRNENIQKRKDEKTNKGKSKKIKRPGFEGSFRGRTGGGKKKA